MSSSPPETLSDYPEYARRVIDNNPQMNESNTKHKLVDPLLRVLGWDMALDVEMEYSVQMGRTTKHVDYSLTHDGGPAVFVEAKGSDTGFSENDMSQLQSYLKQQNVDWGLLTNGREFEVVRRRFDGEDIVVDTVGSLTIDEFRDRKTVLEALSRDSIESGRSARFAKALQERRRARDRLRDGKDVIAERVVEVVADEAGDAVTQRAETHAKNFVDSLVEELERDLSRDPLDEDDGGESDDSFWARLEAHTGVTRGDEGIVFPDGRAATSSFVSFVRFVWEDGHVGEDDLPLKFGRKRYLLHTEPVHSDGDSMYEPREIANGVYVETHASVDQLKRNAKHLAEHCGLWA